MSRLLAARDRYARAQLETDKARETFREEIRAARARGATCEEIGAELGITRQRVSRLERGA